MTEDAANNAIVLDDDINLGENDGTNVPFGFGDQEDCAGDDAVINAERTILNDTRLFISEIQRILSDDVYDETSSFKTENIKIMEQSNALFIEMSPLINHLIRKYIRFNNVCEWDDYKNEALVGCVDAVIKFRTDYVSKSGNQNSKITRMKRQTFAYWFILKRLARISGADEYHYHLFDQDGFFCTTLSNTDYRKNKKKYEQKGFTARSIRSTLTFSELSSERGDGKSIEFVPCHDQNIYEGVF